jgi:hypothetical protein
MALSCCGDENLQRGTHLTIGDLTVDDHFAGFPARLRAGDDVTWATLRT